MSQLHFAITSSLCNTPDNRFYNNYVINICSRQLLCLRKISLNNLDENIELNYYTKEILHGNSSFQMVCERFRGEESLSEFIKSKEEFVKPVEVNLGWDNVVSKQSGKQWPVKNLKDGKTFLRN